MTTARLMAPSSTGMARLDVIGMQHRCARSHKQFNMHSVSRHVLICCACVPGTPCFAMARAFARGLAVCNLNCIVCILEHLNGQPCACLVISFMCLHMTVLRHTSQLPAIQPCHYSHILPLITCPSCFMSIMCDCV